MVLILLQFQIIESQAVDHLHPMGPDDPLPPQSQWYFQTKDL